MGHSQRNHMDERCKRRNKIIQSRQNTRTINSVSVGLLRLNEQRTRVYSIVEQLDRNATRSANTLAKSIQKTTHDLQTEQVQPTVFGSMPQQHQAIVRRKQETPTTPSIGCKPTKIVVWGFGRVLEGVWSSADHFDGSQPNW